MQETKPVPTAYATPAPAPAQGSKEQYIQKTPQWVVVVRGFQAFFAFIIMALCGYLIHGHAMDANVFALIVGLMTWVVVAYSVVTEKFPGAHGSYNIWAVLSLDLLMAILWLASMGANAALRASFIYSVDIDYCVNDGSAISSNTCYVSKRDLERRAAVAGTVGLAVMSAVAGLSALVMLLFIATLVFHGHTFRLYHQGKKPTPTDNANVEMNAQHQTPMVAQQQQQPQQPQQQQAPGPVYPAYPAYPSPPQPQSQEYQGYPQATPPQPSVSPVYSASVQSTPYTQQTAPPLPVPTPSPAPYELPHGQPQTGPYQLPGQEHQQQPGPYQLQGQEYPQQQQQPGPYQLPGQEYPQQQQAGPYQLAASQPYGGNTGPNQAGAYQQPYHSPQGTPAPGQPYYPPAQH